MQAEDGEEWVQETENEKEGDSGGTKTIERRKNLEKFIHRRY